DLPDLLPVQETDDFTGHSTWERLCFCGALPLPCQGGCERCAGAPPDRRLRHRLCREVELVRGTAARIEMNVHEELSIRGDGDRNGMAKSFKCRGSKHHER